MRIPDCKQGILTYWLLIYRHMSFNVPPIAARALNTLGGAFGAQLVIPFGRLMATANSVSLPYANDYFGSQLIDTKAF